MKISLGYSPCPNDTFIFHAIANKKIDLEGLDFNIILADVQELNEMAIANKLTVTKLSYNAYFKIHNNYQLLKYGSALGKACGPLLISKSELSIANKDSLTVAVPGENTTANFLLNFAYPNLKNKKFVLFSDIENMLLNEQVDLGVIIHENRFTYQSKGLKLVKDLGKHWEDNTSSPIPLGGIAIKRDETNELKNKISNLIIKSIQYAKQNTEETLNYCKLHAQEMNYEVMKQHINLYVNEFTENLGDQGIKAIELMGSKVLNTNSFDLPLIYN